MTFTQENRHDHRFEDVLRINLRGTFLGCQVFGARMAAAGYGRLVNIASLAGQNGGTASGAHYASLSLIHI